MKRLLSLIAMGTGSLTMIAQQNNNNFKYLDINQVKAGISPKNLMHFDSITSKPSYEVPKGLGIHSGTGSSVWISGYDNGGNLKTAAQTYRQTGKDFWPGPLNVSTATISAATSSQWNKVWKVSSADISNFLTTHVATSDMLTWPGNGNLANNESPLLAPFVDVNADGIYNTADGDYPKIKGDQALFYIVNDNLAAHTSSGSGSNIGIEMQVMAYAYNCPQVLNGRNELAYTTFYDYKIINRSTTTLNSCVVSLWNDVDLGNYNDDFIGCDITRNLGYTYNGDGIDESSGGNNGYGNYPPAQGVLLLRGPLADPDDMVDNDRNGMIDELFETITMSQFTYFNNSFPGIPVQITSPATAAQYRNYQTGFWKDATPFTCGGNAYGGSVNSAFAYPDNSYPSVIPSTCGTAWNEVSAGNMPGDRSFIMSSGPRTFMPGEVMEIEYAFITSFDSTAANNPLNSLAKLKTDADKVKQFYTSGVMNACNPGIQLGVHALPQEFSFALFPNPSHETITLSSTEFKGKKTHHEITDLLGQKIREEETAPYETLSIDISTLKAGVYFVKVTVSGKTSIKKFVKD